MSVIRRFLATFKTTTRLLVLLGAWLAAMPCLGASGAHHWGPALQPDALDGLPHSAQPVSLASGHLDSDGIVDLVVGYRLADGKGALGLFRGLGKARFPRHADYADQVIDQGPFEPVKVLEIPIAADWLATGDFDAADRTDLAVASREHNELFWWPATGDFTFGTAQAEALGGQVTAMIASDVNRRDGLVDLVLSVAHDGPSGHGSPGAELLIFQGAAGAMHVLPERFELAAPASDLAAGRFDPDLYGDVVAAVGSTLHLVSGRDRKQPWPLAMRQSVEPAAESVFELGIEPRSLASGHFLGRPEQMDLAILTAAGDLLVWEQDASEGARLFDEAGAAYPFDSLLRPSQQPPTHGAANDLPRRLTAAGLGGNRHLLAWSETVESWQGDTETLHRSTAWELFHEAPLAIVPMRLDADAIDDLVVLTPGSSTPSYLLSRGPTPPDLVVNSTDDTDDGTCDGSHCSLREAISAANADPGPDVVGFAIGSGPVTLQVQSSLPPITETITLDATTQPGYIDAPIVELVGTAGSRGLFLDADALNGGVDNSMIRGFVVNRFGVTGGIVLEGQDSIVEGNFVGTGLTGLENQGNALSGIEIQGAGSSLLIGGTAVAARNVISGNLVRGIHLQGTGGDNLVQGNYIGLGRDGLTPVGNGDLGVAIAMDGTLVGGAVPGAGNVIGGNLDFAQRVGVSASTLGPGAVIQGNLIGTDATGLAPQSNSFGIAGEFSLVGGAAPGMANTISGNILNGIDGCSGSSRVQGNRIGTGVDGVTPLGNQRSGLRLTNSNCLIGGTEPGQGNIIAFNSSFAVDTNNVSGNSILGNSIHSNVGSPTILNQVFAERPVLISAASNASQIRIDGSFANSIPGEHRIELFSNPICDASGRGEGERFLGATTVLADRDGAGSFSVVLPEAVPVGHVVTATNTLPDGTTSRFSSCEEVILLPEDLLPTLWVPMGITAGPASFVDVPVGFQANGAAIVAIAFELDFDQTCLGFDPADNNADGLPDSVTLLAAAGFNVSVVYDASDTAGELEVTISQLPPLTPLPDGPLLSFEMSTCSPAPGTSQIADVGFTTTPSPSFGDIDGQSSPGESADGWVEVLSGLRGDCNNDGLVDAGDLAACPIEIFDGDGDFWLDVPGGSFVGNPVGCDANGDTVVDAGDLVCIERLIFGNSCADPRIGESGPRLSFRGPLGVGPDNRVRLEVLFEGADADVLAAALSLDLGPGLAYVDGSLELPGTVNRRYFEVDAADMDGEIDLVITSPVDSEPWADGTLLALEVELLDLDLPQTWVRFATAPAMSFGLANGAGLPGPLEVPSVSILRGLIFGDGFESGDLSRWPGQQP